MSEPNAIIDFWLHEVGPKGWYEADDSVDNEIRARYGDLWVAALDGKCAHWLNGPRGALGFLILTDQFPRNMFRGDPRSFATDALARDAAEISISHGWDVAIAEPERQFFYLPLMHSEDLADQDRCIALIESSMPDTGAGNLPHARVHREIIHLFGRFPYRNEALGRETTDEEQAFLSGGGYRKILQDVENKS